MRFSRLVFVLVVVLALGAGAGIAIVRVGAARHAAAKAAVHAVAVVNGSPITDDDLEVRLEQILPLASYHGNVEADRLVALKRRALDELVLDELIYREAAAAGRRAAAEAVEAELAAVRGRFDNADQFSAALEQNGLTIADFRERLARAVVVREARGAHERQNITERDIEAYYAGHAAKFQRPERVHLLEILIRVDPGDQRSARGAERKARAILAKLKRGEAFDALAREISEDEYRVKDGDMGFVHRGRLDGEFESAVFAAVPGRFAMARSLYGFEVFEVLERQPPTQLSIEEARPIIAKGLARQRREEAIRAWHTRLLARARVEIRDPVLRKARAADLPMDEISSLRRAPRDSQSRSDQ